ncbi:MAG: HDOD domain-containing protein [Candidatus Zixiibacteriota bacterium]
MDKMTILSQVRQGRDLLSLPQALAEILKQVDNPDFGSEQLARIILKDPPLTAKILKMANSSMYRRYSRVSNVHQAVQTLGAVTVKCLALSSSVFHPEQIKADSGIDPQRYFENVLTVAAACEKIAGAIGHRSTEEAFIAGLLHDMGTLLFLHHYPKEYRRVAEGRHHGVAGVVETERRVFGTDHCEVGHLLATRWRLPEYVALAIRDHHSTHAAESGNPIPRIVRLATLMVDQSLTGHILDLETRLPAITESARALGLAKDKVDAISVSLMSTTVATAEYLEVDIGNVESILSRANKEIWRTYFMVENLFKERQELTQRLLQQERARGASETKTIAMATLSHYINNAAMAIYGRSQMLRLQLKKGEKDALLAKLPGGLDVMDAAVKKIVAVLAEMREISPIDETEFLSTSRAMNMDDRIQRRLRELDRETGLVLPEEAEIKV